MMAVSAVTQYPAFEGLRGKLAYEASVRKYTWFRVGGPADILFKPADPEDLASFLSQLYAHDRGLRVLPLGVGSNILIRDGGLAQPVVQLGKAFAGIEVTGDIITAGAGALDFAVSDAATEAGLAGFEFLRGIPGTIGGAVAMNGGAYGGELSDVLLDVDVVHPDGSIARLSKADLQMAYRKATLPDGAIVISARMRGVPDDPKAIKTRVEDIVSEREGSQPLRTRTGGSTFKNPEGHKAWALIDAAGCRGLKRGGAQVSEKHCNFLINTGDATAADLEGLGEDVRAKVLTHSGVTLEWEIKRVGRAAL
ncbi:MAG: UDP-N-acetylmuramate dehydrogenase [Pseudomonadota bacterium]